MKIRAQLRLRNGALLDAMQGAGFRSLRALARVIGPAWPGEPCSFQTAYNAICALARLDFKRGAAARAAEAAASVLGVDVEDIAPKALAGVRVGQPADRTVHIAAPQLIAFGGELPAIGYTPQDSLEQQETHAELRRAMSTKLTLRQRYVLEHRFGLSGEAQTYRTIGSALGVSPARVAQIERQAMRTLEKTPKLASTT